MNHAPEIQVWTPDLHTLPAIVVVIPAYRAANSILGVLEGIPDYVKNIVVVDDCSPDFTSAMVAKSSDTRIVLIRHEKNVGVGGAMLTGYAKALELGAEIVVKMDSDGQMNPKYLLHLIAPILLHLADYTKGNRFLQMKHLTKMPLKRFVGNIGLSLLTKMSSGYWNIFDPTNGYTAIHASILPHLEKNEISLQYFFESSMLIELGIMNAVVRDIPIPAVYSGELSSLSEIKSFFGFPPKLLKGFFRRILIKYFIQDFGIFSLYLIVGLLLLIFGSFFGAYHWYISVVTGVLASTGTIMIAVLPIIFGVLLLIQSVTIDIQNVPQEPLHINLKFINQWVDNY